MSKSLQVLAPKLWRKPMRGAIAIVLLGVFAGASLFAQEKDSDPEAYKLRVDGQFWYANPTATVSGSSAQVPISFDKTFGFTDYSTFNADVDWHSNVLFQQTRLRHGDISERALADEAVAMRDLVDCCLW